MVDLNLNGTFLVTRASLARASLVPLGEGAPLPAFDGVALGPEPG